MSDSPYRIMPRRKRWVEGLEGGKVCLWSFTMAEQTALETYSLRPPEDPRGGYDLEEAALWQIALSCYDGDGEKAKRIWSDLQVYEIKSMPRNDYQRLVVEINRLNDASGDREEAVQDFTPAESDERSSPSSSGVSATSTVSPRS